MSLRTLGGLIIATILLSQDAMAVETGQQVPPWSLASSEGTEIEFPHIAEGRPAILIFWAASCASCGSVLSILQTVRNDYSSHEVEIYAIAIGQGETTNAGADMPGYDFVMLTGGESVAKEYGVQQVPEVVIVDQRGMVAANLQVAGANTVDWNAEVRAALDRLVTTRDDIVPGVP